MQIFPMVIDLSHHDPADDYAKVKAAGYVGVIYKATEGTSYTDPTYVQQQHAAKAVGLLFGAYHFADDSDVNAQISNFMKFCSPDPDELFCLDWEDNGGRVMSAADAKTWITAVETALGRPNQCVIYSGNTAKEKITSKDAFFGARRLWLCHYTTGVPTWQESWDNYWLWQYTDGNVGPQPHTVPGVSTGTCDINSYDRDGGAAQLAKEWATGSAVSGPTPVPPPVASVVTITISAPPGVTVNVRQVGTAAMPRTRADTLVNRRIESGA